MTGEEFKKRFELAWDKPYSAYYDDIKLNRLINYSFYNLVERDYNNLRTQKQYDQITNLIKTGISVSLRDNILHTSYLPITSVTEAADTVTVTVARPHYMDIGDDIVVSDVVGTGVTLINGAWTVTATPSATTFQYLSVGSSIGAYTAGSGKVQTDGYMVTDYFHYFAIQATIAATYSAIVTNIVQNDLGFYADITCPNHNLRTGDTFTLSGVQGFTNANGTYTPSQYTIRNKNSIRLNNITLVGTYGSGGTVQVVLNEWCVPYFSDQKINTLNIPSPTNPRVETQLGTLKFYPSTITSVLVDYMTVIPYEIDVRKTADMLELYYPVKFLDALINETVIQATLSSRDYDFTGMSNQNLAQNP